MQGLDLRVGSRETLFKFHENDFPPPPPPGVFSVQCSGPNVKALLLQLKDQTFALIPEDICKSCFIVTSASQQQQQQRRLSAFQDNAFFPLIYSLRGMFHHSPSSSYFLFAWRTNCMLLKEAISVMAMARLQSFKYINK